MSAAKNLARLLKTLARRGSRARRLASGDLAVRIEAGGIQRTLSFGAAILAEALEGGLVELARDEVTLSAMGAAAMACLDEPAASFLARHLPLARESVETGSQAATVLVDQAESPLAWLHRRRDKNGRPLVAEHAFLAGERLRADFTRANLMPRVTSSWQAAVASSARGAFGALDYSDVVLAARQRVRTALDAVGPELSGVIVDVCCFLKGLELVETERRWPARSAKVVLLLGLERLAVHYGMAGEARGPDHAMSRFWGAEGYRPQR